MGYLRTPGDSGSFIHYKNGPGLLTSRESLLPLQRPMMFVTCHDKLISEITTRGYFRGSTSLFRRYQDRFLTEYGSKLCGRVIELGGENHYNNRQFFPNAERYICTNVTRDYDDYLDITDMSYEDNSQDSFVCVSVLEHIYPL